MRPCKDETIQLNDDLKVVYSYWEDGSEYRRRPGWWAGFDDREYIEPTVNPALVELRQKGVSLSCVEHVSYTVAGTAHYTYETSEGFVETVGKAGDHNIENGRGYLPDHAFMRVTSDGHVTCCVISLPTKAHSWSFDVVPDTDIPEADVVHHISGTDKTIVGYKI